MYFEVRFTNKGAPGVFWTDARSAKGARRNFRLHYPFGRIVKVIPTVVDPA